MTGYVTEWQGAVQDIKDAGFAATIVRTQQTYYVPETDTMFPSQTLTISGYAVQVRGNPLIYQALKLIESDNPTLLFASTSYGTVVPNPGDVLTYANSTYTIRDVTQVAPDGNNIISRLVITGAVLNSVIPAFPSAFSADFFWSFA